jgi:hypothetical protein
MLLKQPMGALSSTPHPTGMLRDGVEAADGGLFQGDTLRVRCALRRPAQLMVLYEGVDG